jgi:hypothetical protein
MNVTNRYKIKVFFIFLPSFYADPVSGLKRVWRIRYTTQPVRKTGWVGGGSEVDGGWGVEPKESSISSEISSFEGKNFQIN